MFKTKTIKPNLTLGEQLKGAREAKKISLEQAEANTLIRAKYLRALEQDNWRLLPGRVYLQGYLRRYSDYLGLDGAQLVAQFGQEFSDWTTQTIKPHKSLKSHFIITPKTIALAMISLMIIAMASYIGYQIRRVTAPPTLVIITPGDEVVWHQDELEIIGRTSTGAVVLINNQNVIQDSQGNFRQKVALQEGLNTIEIIAKSRFDKQTNKTIKVLKTTTSS